MLRSYSILCLAMILMGLAGGASGFPPRSGTIINDTDRSGYGELIIRNSQEDDAVAVLADSDEKPLVAIYIRAGDQFTLSGINDGNYIVYSTSGEDWDEERGAFVVQSGYYRFPERLKFATTDEWYTIIEVGIPPETGTIVKDTARSGYGQLVIHNDQKKDAVAVLADTDVNPLIAVYIRAWDKFTITGIGDGTYIIYATSGEDWDPDEGTFSTPRGYYRFGGPIEFKSTDIGDDVEASVYDVSLTEVPLGESNFVPSNFRFPDLG